MLNALLIQQLTQNNEIDGTNQRSFPVAINPTVELLLEIVSSNANTYKQDRVRLAAQKEKATRQFGLIKQLKCCRLLSFIL